MCVYVCVCVCVRVCVCKYWCKHAYRQETYEHVYASKDKGNFMHITCIGTDQKNF